MTYLNDLGLMLIRGMVGYVMFFHGAQKLFGWFGGGGMEKFTGFVGGLGLPAQVPAATAAWAAALAEFGGGILLMIGLATRITTIPVAATMAVAAFMAHEPTFSAQQNGMEYPLTLMVVTLGLLLTGPGRLSLDNLFRRRTPRAKPASRP